MLEELYSKVHLSFWRFLIKGALRQKGSSGIVMVNRKTGVVRKTTWLYCEYGITENEAFWLTQMADFPAVPKLLEERKNELLLEYVGENLTKENMPTDWELQMKSILKGLLNYGCSHNDIKPADILVDQGRLKLIDFQWATPIGEPPPSHWPASIGEAFRLGDSEFSDEHSFRKAIEKILGEDAT